MILGRVAARIGLLVVHVLHARQVAHRHARHRPGLVVAARNLRRRSGDRADDQAKNGQKGEKKTHRIGTIAHLARMHT